eukprot:TRINITY_DN9006_c0_g1_i1.p1 TRINITY_DN9006_c0_g1~~TRINITY_DN9006_c0_g1_i1.p1  ORF type:complete len:180 (+),score=65.59 TRINITY_DN9006_c0_g1_i1:52-540(+)
MPGRLIQLLGVAGMVVAGYALHVESELRKNPFYEPACNSGWGSCATVFQSPYAHPLSAWGLLPRGHPLDLSLAVAGLCNYLVYALYPTRAFGLLPRPEVAVFAVSAAGVAFSCYLLYVLKFILNDFCIVCAAFHTINFSMFLFGTLPEFRNPKVHVRKARRE